MFLVLSHIFNLLFLGNAQTFDKHSRTFPKDFSFGIGTSSYQIEGAWNVSGKGESIWDRAVHNTSYIQDGSTGDIACDSYHNYQEDIRILTKLKVDCYRFSISWSRIFPTGRISSVNQDGIDYYSKLIDGLIAAGIEPMVTLFHWDTPQPLQDLGGWANEYMIDWYVEYVEKIFQLFGNRVFAWTTFNEPANYCRFGYDLESAPFLNSTGIGSYLCAHNIIKAHAKVYHLYHKSHQGLRKGIIGISLDASWDEPENPDSEEDQNAASIAFEFYVGWFALPIFKTGDYPDSMKNQIAERSRAQGFTTSRLPAFTQEEKRNIRHSFDFLGLNHYITYVTTPANQPASMIPTWENDRNVIEKILPSWTNTSRPSFTVKPESFKKLLLRIGQYLGNDVEILITENGAAYPEIYNNVNQINYLNAYLNAVLDAMEEGANIKAYTWWSLMDSFEWSSGYTQKFGLYHVDFEDPNRTRTPKKSAMVYQNVIVTRKVDPTFNPNEFAH